MLDLALQPVLALGMPGPWEWIVIGVLGVIIFGKRLPSVGRSLGQGIVEFKKGLKGVEDEMDEVVQSTKQLDAPSKGSTISTPESAKADTPSTHSA